MRYVESYDGNLFLSLDIVFQVSELRVSDDEEHPAVRGRAQEADGAAQAELRGHQDVRAGAGPGQAGHHKDTQGKG